ncbi:MAG: hypothetical protein V7K21_11920 [Nostoc sp.]|uniref:hypothetical protein n=1 Tax=Nostoc sp. TaxID=1180 RepID=UPI002FFB15B7
MSLRMQRQRNEAIAKARITELCFGAIAIKSQKLRLMCFTLVRSQSNHKGWDCLSATRCANVVPPLYERLRERNDILCCHCECSASGMFALGVPEG